MLTLKERQKIATNIKRDLEREFPGYVVDRVDIAPDGEWEIFSDERRSRKEYYFLYPNLTKSEADDQIIRDMEAIVARHLPGATLLDFDQQAWNGRRSVNLYE